VLQLAEAGERVTNPTICIQGYSGDRKPGSYPAIRLSRMITTAMHSSENSAS